VLEARKPQATSFSPAKGLDLAVDFRVDPTGGLWTGDDGLVAGVLGQPGRKALLERTGQSVTDLTNIAERAILECGQQERANAPVSIASVADRHADDLLPWLDLSPARGSLAGQVVGIQSLGHHAFMALCHDVVEERLPRLLDAL